MRAISKLGDTDNKQEEIVSFAKNQKANMPQEVELEAVKQLNRLVICIQMPLKQPCQNLP